MIERYVHQIWIQGEDHLKYKSPTNFRYINMWRQRAQKSGYSYQLWSENDYMPLIKKYGLELQYSSRKNLTQKSDIARFLILYEHGGLYIDVDIEPLFDKIPLFYAGVVAMRFPLGVLSFLTLQNAFLGMRKNHDFGKLMLKSMKYRANPNNIEVDETWDHISSTTGSQLIKEILNSPKAEKWDILYLDSPQITFDYGDGYYLSTHPSSTEYFVIHQLSDKEDCNSICQFVRLYSLIPSWEKLLVIVILVLFLYFKK